MLLITVSSVTHSHLSDILRQRRDGGISIDVKHGQFVKAPHSMVIIDDCSLTEWREEQLAKANCLMEVIDGGSTIDLSEKH